MKAFCTLLKNELKLNIRNMNMVIFAVIWPLAVLVILGLLYGTSPAADGVDYTFLAVHGCAVRYLHLRRRADGPAAGDRRVPGEENPETLSGYPHQPWYAACRGISDLCALCSGVPVTFAPGFLAGLGRSPARLLGRICSQLAFDCTFHSEHWHDGRGNRQEHQERKHYRLCAVFPHADFLRGNPAS